MDEKMFNVGKVVNTHGINGEVKVIRITDFEERFQKGRELIWTDESEQKQLSLIISGHRTHKNFDLLLFQGYESIDDAEPLKGGLLKVKEEQLTELDEGEYYYHEIIGCTVYLDTGEELGSVTEILSPGANDVWVVQLDEKDALIPYIEDVVKEVNIPEKKIIIEPIEGLLD